MTLTRTELIQRAINGDLKATYYLIHDQKNENRQTIDGKCTTLFKRFARLVFHNSDDEIWQAIRYLIFNLIIEEDCKALHTVRSAEKFDGWLYRTTLHYVISKKGKQEILLQAGMTTSLDFDTNQSLDDDNIDETGTNSNEKHLYNSWSEKVDILAKMYNARNDIEVIHELIQRFSQFAVFDGKTTLTYATILYRKYIDKVSYKEIAEEIGVSHKNMSNLVTRAMAKLALFAKKEIERYGQK